LSDCAIFERFLVENDVKESLGTLQEFSLGQKVLERRLFC